MKNGTKPLQKFIITVDGKPFIKCDNPTVRIDFKWNKIKCRRFKMCIAQKDADALYDEIIATIEDPVVDFHNLTPQQIRDIIRGIVDNKVC